MTVTLAAVGDIMLTKAIEARVSPGAGGYLFEDVRPILEAADLTFGNLECPLSGRGEPNQKKAFTYCASPSWARVLRDAGFNVLCLANNHILDYGPLAMQDTLSNLEKHGISHVGVGQDLAAACKPLIRDIRGVKIAFLAFTYASPAKRNRPGCCPKDLDSVCALIRSTSRAADLTVVSIHDGLEYIDYPSRAIMTWFRAAADAGATVVLGHHPHVVQGIELYNGSLLCFSLGNFVSDFADEQERRESYSQTALAYFGSGPLALDDMRTTEAFILRCELLPGKIVDYSLTPIRTGQSFKVEVMRKSEAAHFRMRLRQISQQLVHPDKRVLDEIDRLLEHCKTLGMKELGMRDVLRRAHSIRARHLGLIIPFLKAKLFSRSG